MYRGFVVQNGMKYAFFIEVYDEELGEWGDVVYCSGYIFDSFGDAFDACEENLNGRK